MKSNFNPYEDIKKAGRLSRSGIAAGKKSRQDGRNTSFLAPAEAKKITPRHPDEIERDLIRRKIDLIKDAAELGNELSEVWD